MMQNKATTYALPSRIRLGGAILLVTGTAIGAGMLGLPLISSQAGFFPAAMLLILCWLAMYLSGLLTLEVNVALPVSSSFISMADATLGKKGKWLAWATFSLLLYSLMAAYLSAGGEMVETGLTLFFHGSPPTIAGLHWGPFPWLCMGIGIMYAGTRWVDQINRVLLVGLLGSFLGLLGTLLPHIDLSLLSRHNPGQVISSLPVMVTAFGYHVIIPSIRTYLAEGKPVHLCKSHAHTLARVLFLGSALPLCVYLIWEAAVLGVLPWRGPHSLSHLVHLSHPVAGLSNALSTTVHSAILAWDLQGFIFFALASSFLGIALSLFDLLADGLGMQRTPKKRLLLALLTLLPPFLYAEYYPKGFIFALSYAGIFVAVLNIILPAAMAISVRRQHPAPPYQTGGGMLLIGCIILFGLFIIAVEVCCTHIK